MDLKMASKVYIYVYNDIYIYIYNGDNVYVKKKV